MSRKKRRRCTFCIGVYLKRLILEALLKETRVLFIRQINNRKRIKCKDILTCLIEHYLKINVIYYVCMRKSYIKVNVYMCSCIHKYIKQKPFGSHFVKCILLCLLPFM